MKPRRDDWFPHSISLFCGYYDTGPRSGEVRRPFDEHNLLSVLARRLIRVPWSIFAAGVWMFFVAYVRKVKFTLRLRYKDKCFSNFDSEAIAVATSCQLGRSAPDISSSITLRLFSQLESFISDVFIFLPIYWTTSSISLTPHKPYPSVTRQTNWQCCQNRIK